MQTNRVRQLLNGPRSCAIRINSDMDSAPAPMGCWKTYRFSFDDRQTSCLIKLWADLEHRGELDLITSMFVMPGRAWVRIRTTPASRKTLWDARRPFAG